ncbi:MAG: NAD(P)H-dependent oxidoreductase [Rhizobiales bacterium]|nr:NAD(P)H-dependent oxidoreductase [Hyphomicrobiales bacterium]
MMKRIFIIDCNPKPKSLGFELFKSYISGAKQAGHAVKIMRLSEMQFETDYKDADQPIEQCLVDFQNNITWSEHIMMVYPLWWGFMPAKMKGLIDRTFVSGFAYEYEGKKALPKKLLMGRSIDVLVTSDTPNWIFKLIYKAAAFKVMRMQIFEFVGIKPVKLHMFSPIQSSTEHKRKSWIEKTYRLGSKI